MKDMQGQEQGQEMVWVIKKGDYYVNPNFKALFTGRNVTGFTWWTNGQTALNKLEGLGEGYKVEYIDLDDIPLNGVRVYS